MIQMFGEVERRPGKGECQAGREGRGKRGGPAEMKWLDQFSDDVEEAFNTARAGMPEYQ